LVWTVSFNHYASRQIRRLNKTAQIRILKYLNNTLEGIDDPNLYGKPLRGKPEGRWRYRTGDYRIICRLDHTSKMIVVLDAGHRSAIYR